MKVLFYTTSNFFIRHYIFHQRCRPTVTMFHLIKNQTKNMFPHHFKCNRIEKLMNKKTAEPPLVF